MADAESVTLSPAHAPQPRAVEAFALLEQRIKAELLKSRAHWAAHEPRMYARVADVADAELTAFDVRSGDLVSVRAGAVSYGTIIIGKIRLPRAGDDHYIHVRIHDPPDEERSAKDVVFHSLFTNEARRAPGTQPSEYNAIMRAADELEFFDE
ncbi:hypothetical protein FA09DRAFT_297647 [Tilletiopsis washingtonensis]|uniref:Uncharacterized protein n=1 Tax=Tilletiopsis washingtonensis TaxID=58919 RepID=A0A316ZA14_9BASI|nr:hypothetical protein FA09DRAFT_297647 [Tilletiopsis washingtonensis]PWN97848.1 hypothetical protein FA09DRAFT_297647 [Tilletiopsis washingtonensis]